MESSYVGALDVIMTLQLVPLPMVAGTEVVVEEPQGVDSCLHRLNFSAISGTE